ncbi:MAG: response regulator [Sarcina sp.]|nr:response regulator [Sarcina sp.]
MTIIAVNEDEKTLDSICGTIADLEPDAELLRFASSPEALAAAREKEVDIAFLDPVLTEIGGLDLGQYLKELYPQINLIYMTDTKEHSYEAIAQHASGYLLEPVGKDHVQRELEDLRHPVDARRHKRVFAQTFGNFELFVDGRPVEFKYSRTREIFALLVSKRGAQVTNGEIIATLWEDDGDPAKKNSYLSNLRQDLQNTMTRLRLNGIILKQRGSLAVAVDKIECDLYDWLEKKKDSKYRYMGEFMTQYSWSEFMAAELDEISFSMEEEE